RIQPAQDRAGALVDEVDPAEVPARAPDRDVVEVAIPRRHLESPALEADRAVALAQRAPVIGAKRLAQRFARRARSTDVVAVEKPPEWRRTELGVMLVVVLALDPRLRDLVEPGERQVGDVLEHRDQPAFELRPEAFNFRIL